MLYESPVARLQTEELVATLWLDFTHRTDHSLTLTIINELTLLIDRVSHMRFLEALVIRSSNPAIFCSGLSIDTWKALSNPNEVASAVMRGQELTRKISELPMPTVAFVEGTCTGAGLEIALACSTIVAVQQPVTVFRIVDPDVGLIPCFGGTSRLAKRIGVSATRQWFRLQTELDVGKAFQLGLADVELAKSNAEIGLQRLLDRLARGKTTRSNWIQKTLSRIRIDWFGGADRPGNSHIDQEFETVLSRYRNSLVESHVAERQAILRLLESNYTQQRLSLHSEDNHEEFAEYQLIRRVGMICASHQSSPFIQALRSRGVDLTELIKNQEWSRENFGDSTQRFKQDLLLLIGEDPIEMKRQLASFKGRVSPRTILGVVSQSVTVNELQDACSFASQMLGLHRPAITRDQDIIEVSSTAKTSDEFLQRTESWLRDCRFQPVETPDVPGRLTHSLIMAYLSEAVSLVSDGYSAAEVDEVAMQIGFAKSPLEWCDEIGFEELSTLTAQLQLARRDNFARPLLFQKFRPYGWKGKVSREGFYRYGWWKSENQIARMAIWRDHDRQTRSPYIANVKDIPHEIGDRLIYRVLNEASALSVISPQTQNKRIDEIAILTMGWPKAILGPLRLIDDTGILRIVSRLHELRMLYGERFRPNPELLRHAESGEKFIESRPRTLPTRRVA